MYEEILINQDFIHMVQFLTKLPENFCADSLFRNIDNIRTNIDKKKFVQILASNIESKDNT